MRILNERFTDRDVDTLDGIKVFDERGWMQVLPDADEPLLHLYAEGATRRGHARRSRRSSGRPSKPCSRAKAEGARSST